MISLGGVFEMPVLLAATPEGVFDEAALVVEIKRLEGIGDF